MEIQNHSRFKKIFAGFYFGAFAIYLFIGFLPADATRHDGSLSIPKINLTSAVTTLALNGNRLDTPDLIVGSFSNHKNKTLLIGHSKTVFGSLKNINQGDDIFYNSKRYVVKNYEILAKEDIIMTELLKSEEIDTIVVMTCSGKDLGNHDATHRLIITALLNE